MAGLSFIFDMDGTLVDNMAYHARVWVEYLSEMGVQVDSDVFFRQTAGRTNSQILRQVLGSDLSDSDAAVHAQAKEERYRSLYRTEMAPIPGLVEFLEQAQAAGIQLGVATAAPPENIPLVLDGLNLRRFFSVITDSNGLHRGKPDPEIFLKTVERMSADPRRTLVFEDSEGGIEAARRAGLATVAILTGLTPEQAMAYPNVFQAAADFTTLDPRTLIKSLS